MPGSASALAERPWLSCAPLALQVHTAFGSPLRVLFSPFLGPDQPPAPLVLSRPLLWDNHAVFLWDSVPPASWPLGPRGVWLLAEFHLYLGEPSHWVASPSCPWVLSTGLCLLSAAPLSLVWGRILWFWETPGIRQDLGGEACVWLTGSGWRWGPGEIETSSFSGQLDPCFLQDGRKLHTPAQGLCVPAMLENPGLG